LHQTLKHIVSRAKFIEKATLPSTSNHFENWSCTPLDRYGDGSQTTLTHMATEIQSAKIEDDEQQAYMRMRASAVE
jgi:hypothetical protein